MRLSFRSIKGSQSALEPIKDHLFSVSEITAAYKDLKLILFVFALDQYYIPRESYPFEYCCLV